MIGYNYYYQNYNPYELKYVIGIEGANAFQLPPGVDKMILWDADNDSFYIKKLDEMGRPRVVAWKDFFDHVEPTKQESVVETASHGEYLTRTDAEELINKILSQLIVGERGRIVRADELDS